MIGILRVAGGFFFHFIGHYDPRIAFMRLLGVIDTVVIDTFGPEIVDASEPVEPSFEIQTGSAQIVLKGEDAYGSRKLCLSPLRRAARDICM